MNIGECLSNASFVVGIINPDTGEFDFNDSFEKLMDGRFNDDRKDTGAMIEDAKDKINLTRDEYRDKKNKVIGDNESKSVTKIKDLGDKDLNPVGLSGEVAKQKGKKEIDEIKESANSDISSLTEEADRLRSVKKDNSLDHVARRLEQGYILLKRAGNGWDIVASTFDKFLHGNVVDLINQASGVAVVALVVGGKRAELPSGLEPGGIKNFISQQACDRARSVISGLWAKRQTHVRYGKI